jgi:hypothetical protein
MLVRNGHGQRHGMCGFALTQSACDLANTGSVLSCGIATIRVASIRKHRIRTCASGNWIARCRFQAISPDAAPYLVGRREEIRGSSRHGYL